MSSSSLSKHTGVPVLAGCHGWVSGERYVLKLGEPVVIGRSRSCDISLRRIDAYMQRPAGERDADHDFNTVSRRHIRVGVEDGVARIEDLSTNGTYYNNAILKEPVEVDLRSGPVEIRLGTRETFRLSLEPQSSSGSGVEQAADESGGSADPAAPSANGAH